MTSSDRELRRDTPRRCRARQFHGLHARREIIKLRVVRSRVRVSVPSDGVGLRFVEVSRDDAVGKEPAPMIPKDMRSIERLPRTHTDGSAQNRVIDVLPFRSVTVPLNEGLTGGGPLG